MSEILEFEKLMTYKVNRFFHVENRDNLLNKKWRKLKSTDCPTEGHCYIAAEALWHLTDMSLRPYVASYLENGEKATHWWLQKSDVEFDPTADQYYIQDLYPPYMEGRGCGFLTYLPSKRAQVIISWVNQYTY